MTDESPKSSKHWNYTIQARQKRERNETETRQSRDREIVVIARIFEIAHDEGDRNETNASQKRDRNET